MSESIPQLNPFVRSGSNVRLKDSSWSVGLGIDTPDASAKVQEESVSKGTLIPRMTTIQRNAIVSPATGLLVYNLTTLKLNQYNGSSWVEVGGSLVESDPVWLSDKPSYIPYTGATGDVDLGNWDFSANEVNICQAGILNFYSGGKGDGLNGSIAFTSDVMTIGGTTGNIILNLTGISGDVILGFPIISGTLALTSNIPTLVTDLTDVDDYSGHGGEYVKVKAGEDGYEYAAGTGGITDHDLLNNLDYASAGHTGFEASLGNPTYNNYILASQTDGTRSWVALPAGTVTSVFGRKADVLAETNDYTWAQIDKTTSDIADIATKSHTSLDDIGTNTHSDIDSHIADGSIHFLDTSVHVTGTETVSGLKTFDTNLPQSSIVPYYGDDLVNKTYADFLAAGFFFKAAVKVATTTVLPACTYDNGSLGVGATLTGDVNGSIGLIDNYPIALNEYILVKNQASPLENGIYQKTQVGIPGPGGQPWILTRRTDYDTAAEVLQGTSTLVLFGLDNQGSQWAMSSNTPLVIGTNDINWIQISKAVLYTASNGVKLSSLDFQIDLSDTNPSLEISDGGLRIKDDESSIERSASGLRVKSSGITSTMLAGSIADSKLNQITTASKVSGASLTSLASIPSGAGVVPIANLASGTPDGTKFVKDDGTLAVPPGGGGTVDTVVGGTNVSVDSTDPANPIVNSTYTNITPYAEVPSGTVGGGNVTFTLAHTPTYPASVIVVLDGVTQYYGTDYTIDTATITFAVAPVAGSTIFAYYGSTDNLAAQFSGFAKITVSMTAPVSPSNNDLWVRIT